MIDELIRRTPELCKLAETGDLEGLGKALAITPEFKEAVARVNRDGLRAKCQAKTDALLSAITNGHISSDEEALKFFSAEYAP